MRKHIEAFRRGDPPGALEDYDYEAQRLTDLGAGAVLAILTEEGRGKSSGVPVRQSFAALYTVIDGKIPRGSNPAHGLLARLAPFCV